jgi:hypothetical protein
VLLYRKAFAEIDKTEREVRNNFSVQSVQYLVGPGILLAKTIAVFFSKNVLKI